MAEGMKLATAYYELVPSMAGAQGQITQGLTGEMGKAGKASGGRFSSAFGGSVKGLATTLGGLFVAKKAFDFASESVKSLQRIEKINAQTDSAIKATGGAAKVSSKEIQDLTGALEAQTSTEAETIQQGANLLLTFKNVRNEAGKSNDIFNRATTSAVDLSRAGFGSVESASVLLGKALNDPIKGISALGRSGVTFTQQQKDQIKTLVESGDTLKAQKIILKEVEGQVGGAGKAFRQTTEGQIEQFQHQVGTLGEYLLSGLMPVLARLTDFLLNRVVPAVAAMRPQFLAAVAFVKRFVDGIRSGSGEGSAKFQQFRTTVATVFASLRSIFSSAVSIISSLWRAFGGTLTQYVTSSLSNVMTYIRGAFTVIRGIFLVVSSLLRGDWAGVWNGIKTIVRGALLAVVAIIRQAFNVVRTVFKLAGTAIAAVFRGIWNGLKSAASAGVSSIVDAVRAVPGKIKALAGLFKSAGKSVLNGLLDGLKGGAKFVSEIAGKIWNAVKGMINAALRRINRALEIRIKIPGAPDVNINPPDIPMLAKGGVVSRATLAVIGEKGPEAVVPLDRAGDLMGGGGSYVASLVGARVVMDRDGYAEFVDGRIEIAREFEGVTGRMSQ